MWRLIEILLTLIQTIRDVLTRLGHQRKWVDATSWTGIDDIWRSDMQKRYSRMDADRQIL